jgi:hypothetical protein
MEVTMSLLTKELERIDIMAEPGSEECTIAGQTGALKGTKSGESIVGGAVDAPLGYGREWPGNQSGCEDVVS